MTFFSKIYWGCRFYWWLYFVWRRWLRTTMALPVEESIKEIKKLRVSVNWAYKDVEHTPMITAILDSLDILESQQNLILRWQDWMKETDK